MTEFEIKKLAAIISGTVIFHRRGWEICRNRGEKITTVTAKKEGVKAVHLGSFRTTLTAAEWKEVIAAANTRLALHYRRTH